MCVFLLLSHLHIPDACLRLHLSVHVGASAAVTPKGGRSPHEISQWFPILSQHLLCAESTRASVFIARRARLSLSLVDSFRVEPYSSRKPFPEHKFSTKKVLHHGVLGRDAYSFRRVVCYIAHPHVGCHLVDLPLQLQHLLPVG